MFFWLPPPLQVVRNFDVDLQDSGVLTEPARMTTFDWKSLPSGRARFAGSIRGWDETGHDTFAVEVDGLDVYGELREIFTAGSEDFGVGVVSFGYLDRLDVGLPITPKKGNVKAVKTQAIDAIKRVIIELVHAGVSEGSPSFLKQLGESRFTGEIKFEAGWAPTVTGEAEA